MHKDYIVLNGQRVRVELNWNAIIAYLQQSGKDDMASLADFRLLKPSDLAGLLCAGINEGQRLEGIETNYTPAEIGCHVNVAIMAEFLEIFNRQMQPQVAAKEQAKKKD